MDGNGRWAQKKGKTRSNGHKAGAKALQRVCKIMKEIQVPYLTVYAFSTENWKRPPEEVDYLMDLMRQYLKQNIKDAVKNDYHVRVIGDRKDLDVDIQEMIMVLENKTKDNIGLNLQIGINYGGRDEILRGIRKILETSKQQSIKMEEINEDFFVHFLDTENIPDPDLLIRTSGEQRISNFLLWQMAYSELFFTDELWPDFTEKNLYKALEYYNQRNRRFGGV